MQTYDDFQFLLIVIILVLTIVITVLIWQVHRRRQLLERRREVIERENREVEELLRKREQATGDPLPTFRDIESKAEHPQLTIPFEEVKE
jgi:predicted Holliday junction resolvase-like endonuclease